MAIEGTKWQNKNLIMKKLLFSAACLVALSSCYNTRVLVGNVKPNEPMVEINKEWNHHLIYGLVPIGNAKVQEASEYVGDHTDYMIKTNRSFLNYLVGGLTGEIYSPTQTKYYIPLRDMEKK